MKHDVMCLCDVCMPPLPEDALFIFPERERWETELWVFDDTLGDGMWIRAPRTKVWREGENDKELPILRTGLRTSIYGLHDFDVPFVSVHDHEIAAFAAARAGLALPCKVELTRYLDQGEFGSMSRYRETIVVGADVN